MIRTIAIILLLSITLPAPSWAQVPDKKELTTAVNAPADAGCALIPIESRRKTCMSANHRLHSADACNVASPCDRPERKQALKRCVAKRTLSNGAFSGTITDLNKYKGTVWKKTTPGNKALIELATKVIDRIEPGQGNHADELKKAQDRLGLCAI